MENIENKEEEVKKPVVTKKRVVTRRKPGVKSSDETPKKTEPKTILRNVLGKEVSVDDYFFNGVLPTGFEVICGKPVDREELLDVFSKVFKPSDDILFYKHVDKEVYLIIIPIKYSTEIGKDKGSVDGDFQKHCLSFLTEGSVNVDSLKQKLERIVRFVNYTDR